jgi:hypothetical protein
VRMQSSEPSHRSGKVVFLALGSWGDVASLVAVARELKHLLSVATVAVVTHSVHRPRLELPCLGLAQLRFKWLPIPVYHHHMAATETVSLKQLPYHEAVSSAHDQPVSREPSAAPCDPTTDPVLVELQQIASACEGAHLLCFNLHSLAGMWTNTLVSC